LTSKTKYAIIKAQKEKEIKKMKNVKMGFSWLRLLTTIEDILEWSEGSIDQCDEMTLEDLFAVIEAAKSTDK
jgi:hypothetical protein